MAQVYILPPVQPTNNLPTPLLQNLPNPLQGGFIPVDTIEIIPKPWADGFYWSTRNRRPFLPKVPNDLGIVPANLGLNALRLTVILYKSNAPGQGAARFVYVPISETSFVTTVNQDSYIRIEDVINRLGTSCREVYTEDRRLHALGQRPFGAWNQDGTIRNVVNNNTDYYRGLLYGTGDTYASPERMFQKWLNVAAAATSIQKEPWTVISRFWDQDRTGVSLYFIMAAELAQNANGTQRLKDAVQSVLQNAQQRRTNVVNRNNATLNPALRVPLPFVPAQAQVLGPVADKTWFNDKQLVGRHPLDLYDVWTGTAGLTSLPAYKIAALQAFIFTNNNEIALNNQFGAQVIPLGDFSQGTTTTVTRVKINGVRNQTRRPDQTDVMGIGSNNAANLWWQHAAPIDDAEWLHRSAWSYGGLGTDLPASSSQNRQNLFLGSAATNTQMLRWEEFIKRYVLKTGQSALVETTTIDLDNDLGTRKACWLAPYLMYRFRLNRAIGAAFENKVTFAPLERLRPLRFEFEVGRLLDDWNFGWEAERLEDAYDL